MKHKFTLLTILALIVASLACGGQAKPRQLDLYPSSTSEVTYTPVVVVVESSPVVVVVEVTLTPAPISTLCVDAAVAVYLRPSPSNQNYPIMSVPNGTKLVDLGGRSGKWIFVQVGDKQGWLYSNYVRTCE